MPLEAWIDLMSICGAQVCVVSRVLASYSKTGHPTIISSSTVEHRFGRKGFKVPMIGAINPCIPS